MQVAKKMYRFDLMKWCFIFLDVMFLFIMLNKNRCHNHVINHSEY